MITRTASELSDRSAVPLFEVDRFELGGGDQCELHGRWVGVRGRRFMRPVLTVVVDGRRRRLLADLADKPWAPEDGAPWHASFPAPEGEPTQAELTVAPDITVALPPVPVARSGPRRLASAPAARAPEPKAIFAERAPKRNAVPADRDAAQTQDGSYRLQQRITYLEAARTQAAARNNELADEIAQVIRERDAVAAERDAALEARDQAQRETEAVRRKAKSAMRQALSARDDAFSERDDALAMRDFAREERDTALAARDRALAARTAAVSAREASDAGDVNSGRDRRESAPPARERREPAPPTPEPGRADRRPRRWRRPPP